MKMHSEVKTRIMIALLIASVWFAVLQIALSNHETTHAKIFSYYGCTEPVIERDLLSGLTTCNHKMTQESIDNMYIMQMETEIALDYQKTAINIFFAMIGLFAFQSIITRKEQ